MTDSHSWHVDRDEDGIVWLGLDKHDSSANVLSGHILMELHECLNEIAQDLPNALIIHSMKKSGFVAGADIKEFTGIINPVEAYKLIRPGQQVMGQLEQLKCTTVAMINGFALGGGLELALACDYRICADSSKVNLGLPEVRLGIHPGFGGTVRVIRCAGVTHGMDMMLTGRNIKANKALEIGLVDAIAPVDELRNAAKKMALNPPAKRSLPIRERLLNFGPVRGLIAKTMEKKVAQKAPRDHYPAPYAIIDLWKRYGASDKQFEAEARSIAELVCGESSRNLVRVFLLQDQLKALGSRSECHVRRVHVIGAGVMGGDIAAWCARSGLDVTLQDRGQEYIDKAIARAHEYFGKRIRDPDEAEGAKNRLVSDVDGAGIDEADIVIEAIFENLEAKQQLFSDMAGRLKPDAIMATNTSSIELQQIASALPQPDRLIGIHFFNPVVKMPLVEIIYTEETPQEIIDAALSFARRIGKLPVPCKSAPGFLVNRVLMPYLMEAALLGEEGVPLAAIDKIATRFGMPMGPIELTDTVGIDVGYHVGKILGDAFDMPVPESLKQKVDAGELGKKTGKGFYEWQDGKPLKPDAGDYKATDSVTDRLMMPLINEAAALFREGVVANTDLLDAGVIFGTGFAPFRGGPVAYARSRGIDNVISTLQELESQYGSRFAPDSGWEMIRSETA